MATQKSTVNLPPVEQVCIVVKDMDRAIDYYSSVFGWGPFQVREVEVERFTYKGKTDSGRLKIALAPSGPIEIELVQALEGETPIAEFLREKGEGVQHLGFRVDDLDAMLAELAKEGIEPVFRISSATRNIAFLDNDRIGGVMFELIEKMKR